MKFKAMQIAVLSGVATLACGISAHAQDNATATQDKTFLINASEGGTAEIQMSQIALKKSKNDEVKSFAQKMVDDHTTLMSNLKPFADQAGVQPPMKVNPAHTQEEQRLRSMTGDKFDHEYITAMVAAHHKDLGEFKTEASTTSNQGLKDTVTQAVTVIQQHTDLIDAMAQKDGIATPPTSGQ